MKDYDESINNYQKAKALGDSISNYELIAYVYDGIGDIELNRGNYRECIDHALKGLEIAESRKYYSLIEISCFKLFTSYEKPGMIDSAYHYYKKHAEFKETKFNESNTKAITEATMKYEYEKEALADSIRREEEAHIAALEKKNEELENQRKLDRKNNIIYLAIAILGLLFLVFIYIFRQFKAKKKLSEALIKTNEVVLVKQREIGQLEKLENLALHDNKITTLPKELRTIESLTELTFQGNTLMQNEFEELTEWLEAKQPPVPVTRWTGGASGWD